MNIAAIGNGQLDALILQVRMHQHADFYRNIWRDERVFDRLPTVSRSDFAHTPLSRRRYKKGKSLIKIVTSPHGKFLSEWDFDDIRREPYDLASKRALVCLSDPHEIVEKGIWCYENGILRVIAERNHAVTMWSAEKFRITSLITDSTALQEFESFLQTRSEPLERISILNDTFEIKSLLKFVPYAERIRLVLALPETGAFAEADLSPTPLFRPHPDCRIEQVNGRLVLTKLRHLVTPIIRYDTRIYARPTPGISESFTLIER